MFGLNALIREALQEDVGQGDITTMTTVPAEARCEASLVAKQDGVASGMDVFRTVFELLTADVSYWEGHANGDCFRKGEHLARFEARTRAVLTGERVALNFAQRLSGIATMTAAYVAAVRGSGVRIVDTRKTTPLLRRYEKLAVRHGGGLNHRFALYDGILLKENHIVAAGGISNAVRKAVTGSHHLMKIGVEVTQISELDEAIEAGAESILLDNMDVERMKEAVQRAKGRGVVLEASGNVSLDSVRAIAQTGVDLISIGSLTHSAPAVDLSLVIANV